MGTILDSTNNKSTRSKKQSYLTNDLIQDYYMNFYNNLTAKEQDELFSNDIRMLVGVLNKLPESKRKSFIQLFANLVEFYLENKIENEINESIFKVLKF